MINIFACSYMYITLYISMFSAAFYRLYCSNKQAIEWYALQC